MFSVSKATFGVAIALLMGCACSISAQQIPSTLRGSWTATAGPTRVFRGTWSAQVGSSGPNSAEGSWLLLGDRSQVLLQGTWAATKSDRGWQGRWSARIALSSAPSGRLVSGTWQTPALDSDGKTLADMLQRTLEKEVSGAWQGAGLAGNWWLKRR